MNFVFAVLLIAGAAYFLFRRRSFDLFAVAFGGAVFYFLPLVVGHVPDWNERDPFANSIPLSFGAYAVGFSFTVAVLFGAVLFDLRRSEVRVMAPRYSLANWYLLLALVGLIGTATSGDVLDLNKAFVLTQIGYWSILFQTAAALAWIDSFCSRRHVQLGLATLFLVFDLVIGFRLFTIMAVIACAVLYLGAQGRITLWRKLPLVGAALVGIFLFMLTVNSLRYLLLPHVGMGYTEMTTRPAPPTAPTAPAAPQSSSRSEQTTVVPKKVVPVTEGVAEGLSRIASQVPESIARTEPFVTQAILSEVTRRNFSCSPTRIANVAFIFPFAVRLFDYPTTFDTEFKPEIFPNYGFGMAGNIWAEAFCEFGYPGVAVEIALFVLALAGLQILLFKSSSSVVPALALGGVLLAFYAHRNDMLFELLLIRRVAMIFVAAWLLESFRHIIVTRHIRRETEIPR